MMKIFRSRSKTSIAGFTLLELLVIIVMVGILAAIVAPSWLGFLNRQRMSAVRSDLVQTLKQTQQDAIQRRQTVDIEIYTPDNLPPSGENLPAIDNGVPRFLASGNLRPGMVELDSYSVDADGNANDDTTISFDYEGLPLNAELPFVISISGENFSAKQCVIIANLIGSIKTAEGSTCDNPTVDPVDPG
jgi:type II secretory pathway pseudopilin PulG